MSDFVEVISVMEMAWNEVPEAIQNVVPTGISSATTLIELSVDYINHHLPLKRLFGFLTTAYKTNATGAEEIAYLCIRKFPSIAEHEAAILAAVQSPEIADQVLIDCVEACMRKSANAALGLGFAVSLIGVALEALRLYGFWEEIREVDLFQNDNLDQLKMSIQTKVDLIPNNIIEFVDEIDEAHFGSKSPPQRVGFILRKTRERDALRRLMVSIQDEIGQLKGDVDGKVEQLGAGLSSSNAPSMVQAPQGITLGVNLVDFGETAGPIFTFVANCKAIASLATANKGVFIKQKQLELTVAGLRRRLLGIEKLRFVLIELQNKLVSLFDEFIDTLEEGTPSET